LRLDGPKPVVVFLALLKDDCDPDLFKLRFEL